MKIIIIGAGIAGLSTYLHLLKILPQSLTTSITIYESHHSRADANDPSAGDVISFDALSDSTQLVGGALGIGPNGMRILRKLDSEIYERVNEQGFVVRNAIFRAARGWTLGRIRWGDMQEPEEWCVGISRHRLWAVLRGKIGEGVVKYRKVKSVESRDGNVVVRFEDGGEEEEADLVIGADGVKSTVRKAMFDGKYGAEYEGLLGIGGFIPDSLPPLVQKHNAMVFTFGPNGFFGYSASAPKETMWWSTCEAPMPDKKTNLDPETMRAELQARHATWKDDTIHHILEKANVESIYPTWTTPLLPLWGKDGMVLVGDAAHALQPTSGQGSSQALEDGKTLAFLLKYFLTKAEKKEITVREACDEASKAYYKIHSPMITKIVQRTKQIANQKKDLPFVQEMMVYFFMWLMGALPLSISKKLMGWDELYSWDAETEVKKYLQA